MTANALPAKNVIAAIDAIARGTTTARGLAEAQLARIAATDAGVEAWTHFDPERVRARAENRDAVAAGRRGPLHGIGVGVKDIIDTTDMPTEMGSPIYAGHHPQFDAECVARLTRGGGYVFGKTVTTEFAYFHPGKTKNPWNPRHTPGGSSSGSAAAVAAGHVLCAIGTQTNGSVIRPAAYCGVVGFKPTKDAIPRAGVHVFSATLDQIGTFARDVAGAARLASVLADSGRVPSALPILAKAPRLAWLTGFPWSEVECDMRDALEAAATRLRAKGADVVPVVVPADWRDANVVHRTIMLKEATASLGDLQRGERGRMSGELNAALDEGRTIPSSDYETALRRRDQAIAAFGEWLAEFDAVISPPAPGAAPEGLAATGDPACCTLWSLVGFPAIAIPFGRARNGLPLGLQIAAPAGADDRVLAVAAWCEAQLPFEVLE